MSDATAFIWLIIFVIFILSLAPLLFIWAVNTLFSTGITYTFWNWLAGFVLVLIFGGKSSSN